MGLGLQKTAELQTPKKKICQQQKKNSAHSTFRATKIVSKLVEMEKKYGSVSGCFKGVERGCVCVCEAGCFKNFVPQVKTQKMPKREVRQNIFQTKGP